MSDTLTLSPKWLKQQKKYHIAKLIIGFDVNTVLFDELLVPNL